MNRSQISWTERTWNPVFGCTKVSAGCDNCYAERIAKSFGKDFSKVELKPHKLREPFVLKEPSMIFVNSMSDLFHSEIPDSFINQCFIVMIQNPQHTFQILTKRPQRMLNYQRDHFPEGFPENIWLGTSIESNQVIGRLSIIKQVKARVRFVSFEPLLASAMPCSLVGIEWAITGGESDYHNPRAANPEWFREIREECKRAGVAYFHKQNGGSKKCVCHGVWGCELLDGRTWHEYPKAPPAGEPS